MCYNVQNLKKIFFIFSLVKLFERWNKLTLYIVNSEIGYNTEMSYYSFIGVYIRSIYPLNLFVLYIRSIYPLNLFVLYIRSIYPYLSSRLISYIISFYSHLFISTLSVIFILATQGAFL